MNGDLERLENLWEHITGACQNQVTPCLTAIHDAMVAALSERSIRPLRDVARRIAKNHCEFERYGTASVLKVSGEWHISNAGLLMWADLSLFGRRDFFPDNWGWLSSEAGRALREKHTWQTLERYKANGGLLDDHRKLLARLIWDFSPWRGDGVSLYVQGKRPFGNSCRVEDMMEILGWEYEHDADDYPAEMVKRCWELFDELQFAIIDALAIDTGQKTVR